VHPFLRDFSVFRPICFTFLFSEEFALGCWDVTLSSAFPKHDPETSFSVPLEPRFLPQLVTSFTEKGVPPRSSKTSLHPPPLPTLRPPPSSATTPPRKESFTGPFLKNPPLPAFRLLFLSCYFDRCALSLSLRV